MPVRIPEFLGYLLGWPLGLILAAGSILRNARIFHPRGTLLCGEVETLTDSPVKFPAHVLVRFSGGWWKYQEWPDALGVALRFSETPVTSVVPKRSDMDILFATFRRPWQLLVSPMFTEYHDYLSNSYYAISPFETSKGMLIDLMIDPIRGHRSGGTREDKLLGNVLGGKCVLRVMMKEWGKEGWRMVARILLKDESPLDQEALRFHPFLTGPELRPYGFLQHLRFGPYQMSQWVRPGGEISESEAEELSTD